MACNDLASAYWREHTYTYRDVVTVMAELEELQVRAVALGFLPNQNLHCVVTKKFNQCMRTEGHLPAITRIFSGIHRESAGTLKGWIVMWAEDHMWGDFAKFSERVPVFAFGRGVSDPATFIIPDPAFIMSDGYIRERKEIEELQRALPWEKKEATVFWRGATSGYGFETENWRNTPRLRLCLEAKELGDKADVAFSKIIAFSNPEHEKRIRDLGVVKEEVPFRDFLKYRYQVDIDGFANAWRSCFLKLASHCVTLKAESSTTQWYYDQLVPWQHFIPLNGAVSDFKEAVRWLHEHDAEAQTIAERAFALTQGITFDQCIAATKATLIEVLARIRD
jgi:hypothetical protein